MSEHLDAQTWERLAMGELAQDERDRALRHATSCKQCARVLKGLLLLERGAREIPGARPAAPARRRWLVAGGAALAAAAALAIWLGTRPPKPATQMRGPDDERVELIAPRGDVAGAPELSWQPVEGAGDYRVEVFTEDGRPLWQRDVAAPPLAWPAGTSAAPGVYRWRVTARKAGAAIAVSRLEAFRIR
jgi:hypothetical protein